MRTGPQAIEDASVESQAVYRLTDRDTGLLPVMACSRHRPFALLGGSCAPNRATRRAPKEPIDLRVGPPVQYGYQLRVDKNRNAYASRYCRFKWESPFASKPAAVLAFRSIP